MKSGVILIDFDNVANFGEIGRPPKQHNITAAIEQIYHMLHSWASKEVNPVNEILLRFYGGWCPDNTGTRTDRYWMLQSSISKMSRIYGKIRFRSQIAESIAADNTKIFPYTLTNNPLTKPFTIACGEFSSCENGSNCRLHNFMGWVLDGCDAPCKLRMSNLFKLQE
jgi:hypothetical protein